MLAPWAMCVAYPEAPLSRIFRWCFNRFGQESFVCAYASIMLLLTVVALYPFKRREKHNANRPTP